MTKKRTFHQVFWQIGAVDLDIGSPRAMALLVDLMSKHLLARSALPLNHHRGVILSDLWQQPDQFPDSRIISDNLNVIDIGFVIEPPDMTLSFGLIPSWAQPSPSVTALFVRIGIKIPVHPIGQLIRLERLGDVVVGSLPQGVHAVPDVAEPGDQLGRA